jgi:hypothetical protein
LGLADVYQVALWNYCAVTNSTNGTTTKCSSPKAEFWFDPLTVWGIGNDTELEDTFSSEFKSALKTYKTASKWMFIVYIIALVSTIVELLFGIVTLFWTCGCLTWIISTISSVSMSAASVLATVIATTVVSSIDTILEDYGVKAHIGWHMLAATWIAVAFNIAASFFWLLSRCCCPSVASSPRKDRRNRQSDAEKLLPAGGYAQVRDPAAQGAYMTPAHPQQPTVYTPSTNQGYNPMYNGQESGHTGYPMQTMPNAKMPSQERNLNSAYEPYRHDQI